MLQPVFFLKGFNCIFCSAAVISVHGPGKVTQIFQPLLNRFHRAAVERSFCVNVDDAIDSVGVQLIGIVPEDPEVTFRLPGGEALPKKSPARRAWERIAARIEGENVPLDFRALS